MKNTIFYLALSILLFCTANISFSQSLYVMDPQGWDRQPATIDEASLSIHPKGAYFEYGLYLTISAKGSYYQGSANPPLEIVMDFCLPQGSIIHDSWLWVGNDIMQAILIDRGLATQIYEGIVDRRKDPSILTKNSDGCYQLRVYPLAGNSSRKLKITYLVPARWTRHLVSAPLPINVLATSHTMPDLNLTIYTDGAFQGPMLNELGFLPYVNQTGGNVYTSTIPAATAQSYNNLEFSYASPLQNGWFACDYPTDSAGGFYQLVMHPQEALQLAQPQKIAIVLELSSTASNAQKQELFTKTKEMLNEYFLPTDSFNVFFVSSQGIQKLGNNWLAASPNTIQSAFTVVPALWQGTNTTNALVNAAINFVRVKGGDGEILLISNNNNQINTSSANQMITSMVTGARPNIPINILNYADLNNSYYGTYYSYMDYVYHNVAVQTGGNYVKHQFSTTYYYWDWWQDYYYGYRPLTSFSDLMHNMFASFNAAPENYSLNIEPDNGFCYSEFELNKTDLAGGQTKMFVGKYYGTAPLTAEYRGLQNGTVISQTTTLQPYAGDSLTGKIWAGSYINSLEKGQLTNATKKAIIDTSMAYRALSLYTAFLALEPNDTLQACENCEDDSNNGEGGGGAVAVPNVDEVLASLSAAPNPFSGSVTITITNAEELKDAELRIFNMMGQEVKVFKDLFASAKDTITIIWNGDDANGLAVPDGVYMAVLVTPSGKQIIKLVKAS